MDTELNEMMGQFLSRQDAHHAVQPRTYHASSVFSCYRRNYYKHKGIAATNPLPLALFENGRRTEDVFFEGLQLRYGMRNVNRGIGLSHAMNGMKVVGKTDEILVVNSKPDTLFEVKSTEEMRGEVFKPYPSHFGQTAFYATELAPRGLRRSIIVQIDQTSFKIRTYAMSEDEISYWSFEGWKFFETLDGFMTSDLLPPAVPFADYECESKNGTCPFLDRCRADGGWKKVEIGGDDVWIRNAEGR
jgi:hypothetical protein